MKQYNIRILYKSGYTHDFWVNSFAFEKKPEGLSINWEAAEESNHPLLIGVDDVAAVWQLGTRGQDAANDSAPPKSSK